MIKNIVRNYYNMKLPVNSVKLKFSHFWLVKDVRRWYTLPITNQDNNWS